MSKSNTNKGTDRDWEHFAQTDPYYFVLTQNEYKKSHLSEENREAFFLGGEREIDYKLKIIRKHIDTNFKVAKALDFGCGVGRLTIPISKLAEQVTGIDVSETMLSIAQKNCEVRSIKNVRFVKSDDDLSALKEDKFNFICSHIVFQHIPVERGERIFENLLSHLEDGGVGVIYFFFWKEKYNKAERGSLFLRLIVKFRKFYKKNKGKRGGIFLHFIRAIKNQIKLPVHPMQMNEYDLNTLFSILCKYHIVNTHIEFTDHKDLWGVNLFFKKPITNNNEPK